MEMHEVFRNQPSYTVFNKSFDHAGDSLYAFLNEMDPDILNEEQHKESQIFSSYECRFERQDPRTQEVIRQTVYDHTNEQLQYTFPNAQKRFSVLGRAQHSACLRVLLSFQQGSSVDEADFVVWRTVQSKWATEQQVVQKYVYDYASLDKERLYAPMKPLVDSYRKWLKLRMQHLLPSLPNESYITHTGLPQLQQCKNLNVDTASMEQVELLFRTGNVRYWPEVRLSQNYLRKLRLRLDRYAIAGVAKETHTQLFASELQRQLQDVEEDVFVLPLDAMLLLLMPGAYVDMPTEMLLHIRNIADGRHKCFEFHEPLPPRNCGWHTNNHIVTEAYAAYAPDQMLQFTANGVMKLNNDLVMGNADQLRQPEYKLHPIDEEEYPIQAAQSNSALISWRLKADRLDPAFLMCSTLSIAAVRDALGKQPLGCHLIKLENKPECGCEIMTKYELISAWLQMKLNQTNSGHCTRISLRDFELMLEQQLTLDSVEKQLHEHYKISMPQQLCQLHEFLKLLRAVAPGKYLLRYSPKYIDKFLLCRPTLEKTAQCFQLHELILCKPPTNFDFITDNNSYLPISASLVSRLHEQLQLLPCAFVAKEKGVQARRTKKMPTIELKPKIVQRTKKQRPKIKRKRLNRQRKRAADRTIKEQDKKLEEFMCL